MTRQRFWILITVALGTLSAVVLNCLLHSGRRPWIRAGADILELQGVLAAGVLLVALPLVLFRRIRSVAATTVVLSLMLLSTTVVSLFVWAGIPADLSAHVMNSSQQDLTEVVFVAGDNTSRLMGLAAGERRSFRFRVDSHEGSMVVRAKTIKGQEISAECHTYINWALARADYDVEIAAAADAPSMRCVERGHELKF